MATTTQEMTVKAFAKRLDVPLSTAYRIVSSGQIKVANIGTGKKKRRIRITEANYQKYLTSREMKGSAA